MILTKVFEWQNNNCNYGAPLDSRVETLHTRVSATIIIRHGINMRHTYNIHRCVIIGTPYDAIFTDICICMYLILALIYGLNYAPAWFLFGCTKTLMVMAATRESRIFMII